jgi:hypothetical protein
MFWVKVLVVIGTDFDYVMENRDGALHIHYARYDSSNTLDREQYKEDTIWVA